MLIRTLGRKKDKWKDLPPSLQSQWESDRKKKADRKRERELEKLIQAADPMEKKKGGKKGRNAMLAVAGLDPTIQVIPNRIIDPTTLVQQIKRFIANIGGPLTMSLPPTNKQTRKHVHELAMAFGLKSVSKGKGDSRYTTLTKSSRTGQGVDERKVSKVMRIMGARGGSGGEWGDWAGSKGSKSSGGGGGGGRMPHHKEGEEVGKVRWGVYDTMHFTNQVDRRRRRLAKQILGSGCWHLWDGRKEHILALRKIEH